MSDFGVRKVTGGRKQSKWMPRVDLRHCFDAESLKEMYPEISEEECQTFFRDPIFEGSPLSPSLSPSLPFQLPPSLHSEYTRHLAEQEARNTLSTQDLGPNAWKEGFRITTQSLYLGRVGGGNNTGSKEESPVCECSRDAEDPEDQCGENCLNAKMLIECNLSTCPLREKCHNRRMQKRKWAKVSVRSAGKKGWGLFSDDFIPSGSLIIEYVGEVIPEIIAHQRMTSLYLREKHTFLLKLKEDEVIDATRIGNVGRFINHSCDPNAVTQKWQVLGDTRVGIFALKDLPKDTEITFDYALERLGDAEWKCYCGAERCRGLIKPERERERERDGDSDTQAQLSQRRRQRHAEVAAQSRTQMAYTAAAVATLYSASPFTVEERDCLSGTKIPSSEYHRKHKTMLWRNVRSGWQKLSGMDATVQSKIKKELEDTVTTSMDEFGLTKEERERQMSAMNQFESRRSRRRG